MKRLLLTNLLIIFSLILLFPCYAQELLIAEGDSVQLSIENDYRGEILWQQSKDSVNWIDIEGATENGFWISPEISSYYRAEISEENCEPIFSSEHKVFLLPKPIVSLKDKGSEQVDIRALDKLEIELLIDAPKGVDSILVYNSNDEIVFTAGNIIEEGVIDYKFSYNVPEDIGFNQDEDSLFVQVVDILGQKSNKSSICLIVVKEENEIYYFNLDHQIHNIIAQSFDAYGNHITLYGSKNSIEDKGEVSYASIISAKSDTLINFVFGANSQLEWMFFSLKSGEILTSFFGFNIASDSSLLLSQYNYNYQTNQSSLVYQSLININGDSLISIPSFTNLRTTEDKFLGVPISFIKLGIFVGASTFIILSAPTWALAVGATIALTTSFALANDETKGTSKIPDQFDIKHYSAFDRIDFPNNKVIPCQDVFITFDVDMDSEGTVLFSNWSGGSGGWEYSLDKSPFQPNPAFTNIEDGSYLVQVKDDQGCIGAKVLPLKRPEDNCVNSDISISATLDETGKIIINASGVTAPYEYAIDELPYQTSSEFNGDYPAGSYNIKVKDSFGCEFDESFNLDRKCADISINASLNFIGEITINASGGLEPYDYAIGDMSFQSSNVISGGYEPGIHLIQVQDANSCITAKSINLEFPEVFLEKLSGDNQVSQFISDAGIWSDVNPLVVIVIDSNNQPVENVDVIWIAFDSEISDTPGYNGLTNIITTSNSQGMATVNWKILNTNSRVTASIANDQAEFLFRYPYSIDLISGNNQTIGPMQPLPENPIITVKDRNGQPLEGVNIELSTDHELAQLSGNITDENGLSSLTIRTGIAIHSGLYDHNVNIVAGSSGGAILTYYCDPYLAESPTISLNLELPKIIQYYNREASDGPFLIKVNYNEPGGGGRELSGWNTREIAHCDQVLLEDPDYVVSRHSFYSQNDLNRDPVEDELTLSFGSKGTYSSTYVFKCRVHLTAPIERTSNIIEFEFEF